MSFSDFERSLLRSAASDQPTAEARQANRAAVIRGAGFAVAAQAATTTAARGKALALPKLLAVIGVVAAVAAVAAVVALRPSGSGTSTRAAPSTAPVAPAPVEDPTPLASAIVPEVTAPVENTDAKSARTTRPSPSTKASPSPDPLAEEARLLQAARACVDAKNEACASAKLTEYRMRFPRGVLADEAALMGIELAQASGHIDEAKQLASALLRANPVGPYARRARAILGE